MANNTPLLVRVVDSDEGQALVAIAQASAVAVSLWKDGQDLGGVMAQIDEALEQFMELWRGKVEAAKRPRLEVP